jgi:hypothetical protein
MEIVLKTREELGLSASTGTSETGIAKDLFKGLSYVLNNRKGTRPSVTFIDEATNKSQTVTVEETLEEPVRTGKITINHLLGFTVIKAPNNGLYFLAPKTRATGKVDDTEVKQLDAVSYNELAGY